MLQKLNKPAVLDGSFAADAAT